MESVAAEVSGAVRERFDPPVVYPIMQSLRFREERTTQAAAYLLNLRGGRMSYMKLIKLMYFADRKALLELGRPITFDQWVSMPHGPVLSRTYDLIAAEPDPDDPSYWRQFITTDLANYEVELSQDAPHDQLSAAEEEILKSVFDQWGSRSRWDVRDASHELPEYTPTFSSVRIPYRDVLILEGRTEEEARAIECDLEAEESLAVLAD